MTTVFDVPAEPLIRRLATKLKDEPAIKAPAWAQFAKTGVHREKAPQARDWWHVRVAALLRKINVLGPVGVERLRAEYGGRRDRGAAPNRAKLGSGSIVREAVQQLEAAGLVESVKAKGRRATGRGRKLLDSTAHEVAKDLEASLPALAKY